MNVFKGLEYLIDKGERVCKTLSLGTSNVNGAISTTKAGDFVINTPMEMFSLGDNYFYVGQASIYLRDKICLNVKINFSEF